MLNCPKSFGIIRYDPELVKKAILTRIFFVPQKPPPRDLVLPQTNYAWIDSPNIIM